MTGREADFDTSRGGSRSRGLLVGLLVVGLLLVVRSLGPQTVGEQARRSFLATLREHYPELQVSIRRGRYDPQVGLVFEDVKIADPRKGSALLGGRQMLRIERLVVVGQLDAGKLLEQRNPLVSRRIVIDGVEADCWLDSEGELSLSRLWPPPRLGPVCPRIELRRVSCRLSDSPSRSRPIRLDLAQTLVRTSAGADGSPRQTIQVQGSTDFADSLRAEIVSSGGRRSVRLTMSRVHVDEPLLHRLPADWCPKLDEFRELDATGDLAVAASQDAAGRWDYRAQVKVLLGRLHHRQLPLPLSQLRGTFTITPEGVELEPSQCVAGDAVCRLSGKLEGLRWPCPLRLDINTSGLMVDGRLASAAPPPLREQWDRLRPTGRVDVDAEITHQSGQWDMAGSVTCKGVDVSYDKFPYPVTQLVGKVSLEDGVVRSDGIRGRLGGAMLRCKFEFPMRPETSAARAFVLESDGPIPIDRTLLAALSPRAASESPLETFVRSLRPSGSVVVSTVSLRTDPDGTRHRRIDLDILNGHLRYDRFAYPLYNVNGQIHVDDDVVQLAGFKATNANAGTVRCDGYYHMAALPDEPHRLSAGGRTRRRDSELHLRFQAANVSMDESLRSSLPDSTQHVWDAVSPGGMLDRLTVLVRQEGAGRPLDLDITAVQQETPQVTNRSLTLRPAALPYRLDITGGTVHYDGDQVTITSVIGRHDASHLSTDGRCVRTDDGRWVLSLDIHGGSRLFPDAELIEALPDEMEEAMRRLQLRGPVSVRGETTILLSDETNPEPTIDWDLLLQLEGNRIGDVGPVHSLRGELSVQGRRDANVLTAAGEVRIDSMHVHDLQIMGIRGPFAIRDDLLRLGAAPGAASRPSGNDEEASGLRTIRGGIFGGTLDVQGVMRLSSGEFDVGLAIQEGRVPTLLADLGHGDRELTGTFAGQTRLAGKLGAPGLLNGRGAAQLTGANLYKLPLLVQVLNQLRITPTEDVAFTDGDVEFTIDDDQFHFSQLQLWGDLVALHGVGTLDRRGELDLTFNTRVSPQNLFTKVIGPLKDTRYTLWTIDVQGPLDSPTIERRALDGFGHTIELLFPGISGGRPATGAGSAGAPQRLPAGMSPRMSSASGSGEWLE